MRRRRRSRPTEAATSAAALGRHGEQLAAAFLRSQRYRVVARNLRTRGGELDLLVRRRRLWVAVEVKTRTHHPAPEQSVDDDGLRRLERALAKLAPQLRPRPRRLRVDVVAVRLAPGAAPEIRHFMGDERDVPA